MIKKEGGTMDRDTIFLYVIAGLAFLSVMFGLDPDIHRFPGQAGE